MEALENRPEIRCSHVKGKIKALELLDTTVRDRVLARLSKSTFDTIQSTKDDEWVPVEFMVEIVSCLVAEIGEQGLYDWNTKAFTYSIDASSWGTFLRTAINLFGIKTTALVQLGPYIWKRMYHNCGDMSITRKSQNQDEVLIRNLPPMITGYRAYLLGTVAGFVCLCALGNMEAKVSIEQPRNTQDVAFLVS